MITQKELHDKLLELRFKLVLTKKLQEKEEIKKQIAKIKKEYTSNLVEKIINNREEEKNDKYKRK